MTDFHDFDDDDSSPMIIGLILAVLTSAIIGMVAGAIGAPMAWITWGAS